MRTRAFLVLPPVFLALCAVTLPVHAGEALAPAALAVEGQPADIGRFAYAYRKGAVDNPRETQWLHPTPDLLCGLLWEERRPIRRIEVEFPARPATVPAAKELSVVTRTAAAPFEEASAPGFGIGAQQELTLKAVGGPLLTPRGSTVFTFASQDDINSIKLLYSGNEKQVGTPELRAFGPSSWKKPVTLEIQWAFQPNQAGRRWDGRVEAYNGYVGPVAPLGNGCGVTAVAEHAWKDGPETTAPRGIKLPVLQTAGEVNSRTIVTLWTTAGDVSFAPRDLESGPILIPSVGIFISAAGSGITARQFQAEMTRPKRCRRSCNPAHGRLARRVSRLLHSVP